MKVDLHVHTSERSFCASSSEKEQIQAAIAAGLDAIFITDHAHLVPTEHLHLLNQQYAPFRIFGGIEITIGADDLLVLGVHDGNLERQDWIYPALHAFVQAQNGFIALAHPFRYRAYVELDMECYKPDGIEVYSPNTPKHAEKSIRELAERLGLSLLSNSDAHTTERLGTHYNLLLQPTETETELLALLKAQQFNLFVQ